MYSMNTAYFTRGLLWIALTLFAMPAVNAAKMPEIPMPEDARVTRMGESMRVNGNDVIIRTFTSKESAQDVVDFYREEWGESRNAEPGYTINNLKKPWTLISRIENEYLITVQVRADSDDASFATVAISRLSDRSRAPKLGEGFPTMGGSDVLNEVVSKDLGQSGRTMMLGNKHDMATNVDFYREQYGAGGWAFDLDRDVGGMMHVLALRKARQRVNMVISKSTNGGTVIVVNEVTHDIL
jgi:hypothetical protein